MGITIWQIAIVLIVLFAIIAIYRVIKKLLEKDKELPDRPKTTNNQTEVKSPTQSQDDINKISYYNVYSKNQTTGFLLSFLFGPLGIFYSNWVLALIYTIIAVIGFATIIIPIVIWILSITTTYFTVAEFNRKVRVRAKLL